MPEAPRLSLAAAEQLISAKYSVQRDYGKTTEFATVAALEMVREAFDMGVGAALSAAAPAAPAAPGKMTREAIDRAAHYAIDSDLLAPVDWEAAGFYDFAHALTGGIGVVDDLRTLVVRLARALRQAAPANDLADKAADYLRRHGLDGSPLRDSAAPQAPAEDQGVAADAARYRWLREQGMLTEDSRHPQSWRCIALLADMGGEHADAAIDAAIAAKEPTNA